MSNVFDKSTDVVFSRDMGQFVRIGNKCYSRVFDPLVNTNVTHTSGSVDETDLDTCVQCEEGTAVFSFEVSQTLSGSMYSQTLSSPGNSWFGESVCVSGEVMAVGVPHQTSSEGSISGRGVVYVFRKSDGVWAEESVLSSELSSENESFGSSVAVQGDRLFVGAPNADPAGSRDAGAVYIFEYDNVEETWYESRRLVPSLMSENDSFGISLDVDGDLLIVGAHREDVGGKYDSGAAFVFKRHAVSGTWSQTAILSGVNAQEEDGFGFSVAVSGKRVIVGAPWALIEGVGRVGRSFVFEEQADGSFLNVAALSAVEAEEFSKFGFSVDISEDRAVVGAPASTVDGRTKAGTATTFLRDPETGNWGLETVVLTCPVNDGGTVLGNPLEDPDLSLRGEEFGTSVSLSRNTLAVGAPNWSVNSDGVIQSGMTVVFVNGGWKWEVNSFFVSSEIGRSGHAVSVHEDTVVFSSPDANVGDDDGSGTVSVLSKVNTKGIDIEWPTTS